MTGLASSLTETWERCPRTRSSVTTLRYPTALPSVELRSPLKRVTNVSKSGLAGWQIRKIVAHIEATLDRPTRVDDLAGLLQLSRSYFSRAFKSSIGISPHKFIVARRVASAMQAMATTETPLSEIALMCGFSDQAHLSRVFRETAGASPHAWRQRTLARDGGSSSANCSAS